MQNIVAISKKTQQRIDDTQRSLLITDIIAKRKALLDDEDPEDQGQPAILSHDSGKDKKDWQDEAKKDPYILEAMAIIKDMNTHIK